MRKSRSVVSAVVLASALVATPVHANDIEDAAEVAVGLVVVIVALAWVGDCLRYNLGCSWFSPLIEKRVDNIDRSVSFGLTGDIKNPSLELKATFSW